MNNLFQMIKNFNTQNSKTTYGDILSNKAKPRLNESDSRSYDEIKKSDKDRLVSKNSGSNPNGLYSGNMGTGIHGNFVQIC